MIRRLARVGTAFAVTGAVTLVASPAWAHVTADPDEAPKGGFAAIDFRVPNESDTAATTQIEISYPTETPIAVVSVKPKPGWTATVETTPLAEPAEGEGEETTEAVSKITWTGGRIEPGQFDEFEVSMGPLPDDADELVFPALQTYDDGEVVRWIEPTPPGGEEPEFPAPTVRLIDSSDAPAAAEPVESSGDDGTDAISVIALIVGALGLITAVTAIVLGRRRA